MRILNVATVMIIFCVCLSPVFGNTRFDRNMFFVPKDAPSGTWALMEKAANLAAKNPHCVQVIGGAWSTKQQAAEDGSNHPSDQFYVQCQSDQAGPVPGVQADFNLYYSYKDLREDTIKRRPVPVSDKTAITECKRAILLRLKYPSSADMRLVRYGTNGTDNNLVVYDFTTLNGFGNRIPQEGNCIIDPSNNIDVDITNR